MKADRFFDALVELADSGNVESFVKRVYGTVEDPSEYYSLIDMARGALSYMTEGLHSDAVMRFVNLIHDEAF